MVEEHIAAISVDLFVHDFLENTTIINKVRLGKELVKFNERCFLRLLGDMCSYNFVVDITTTSKIFNTTFARLILNSNLT